VSPLLRDSLRLALYPDRVVFARYRRGLRPKLAERGSIAVDPGPEDEPWRGALAALPPILKDRVPRVADACIAVSSHFVRHLVLRANPSLSSREEWLEYASHQFEKVYGERARAWDIRVARGTGSEPRLGSAMDKALVEGVLAAFKGTQARLQSIRPVLVTAFNRCVEAMREPSFWFVLQEPGRLVIGLIRDGVWEHVRGRRAGVRWTEELAQMVEREGAVLAGGAPCREALLYSMGGEEAAPGGLKLTALLSTLAADEQPYAMVCG
jgi:hypothetical protein